MITVYEARDTAQFVRYGNDGLGRFSYGGFGEDCYPNPQREPWRGFDVKNVIKRMQATFPLGWIGDYEILCLPTQLAWLDGYGQPTQQIEGERWDGFIALSVKSGNLDLFDLITHEITHEWWRRLSPELQAQFWKLTMLAPGSPTDDYWHRRPQELAAEHLTTAIFGTPLDERMTRLSDDVYARVRLWAMSVTPADKNEVIVMSDKITIELDVNSTVAKVNGETKTLDVPATVVNGRTLVPLRFIAEAFGAFVNYDNGHITITLEK